VYVTIRNQTKHLLICRLNSGQTIHLAPSETSKPVDHLEINGNENSKLVRSGFVTIAPQEGDDGQAAVMAGRRRRKEKV